MSRAFWSSFETRTIIKYLMSYKNLSDDIQLGKVEINLYILKSAQTEKDEKIASVNRLICVFAGGTSHKPSWVSTVRL